MIRNNNQIELLTKTILYKRKFFETNVEKDYHLVIVNIDICGTNLIRKMNILSFY